MTQIFFVTGTDTNVGKTAVAAALLLSARAHGLRAAAVKPVAAGCEYRDGRWVNADADLLQRLAGNELDYGEVNPVALPVAMAPHIAAARAGVTLRSGSLADTVAAVAARHRLDVLLVEGAGGWLVPLNGVETMADVAVRLRSPVILVVGMKLGCLNHALLTARAIADAGLPMAGWVANSAGPAMDALEDNIAALEARLPALRLGSIPWLGDQPASDRVATWLDGTSLWTAPVRAVHRP